MNQSGPHLETLTRRLADTPPDFMDEPRVAGSGRVAVPALVNDLAGILSPEARSELEQKLTAHEQVTSQQFVLLTVPTLGGEEIEDFSIAVAEAWKPGSKKEDNGLVMVVALQDHRTRVEVGDGLEGVIPDILAARVTREVLKPAFRANDYVGGITRGFDILMAQGRGDPNAMPKAPVRQQQGASPLLLLFVLFFVYLLIKGRFGRGRRGGGYYGGFGGGGFGGGGFGGGGFGGGGGGGFSGGGGSFSGGGASGDW